MKPIHEVRTENAKELAELIHGIATTTLTKKERYEKYKENVKVLFENFIKPLYTNVFKIETIVGSSSIDMYIILEDHGVDNFRAPLLSINETIPVHGNEGGEWKYVTKYYLNTDRIVEGVPTPQRDLLVVYSSLILLLDSDDYVKFLIKLRQLSKEADLWDDRSN